MPRQNAARKLIAQSIERVQRHGLKLTPENVKANISIRDFTLGEIEEGMTKHVYAQIPVVMKEQGLIIADPATRERKPFWEASADDLDEQTRIKEQSSDFDRVRLVCDKAVVAFLREKESELGYEVYPGLFHAEIDRIYAMHGLDSPGA
jgi:hypothetical protein